MIGLTRRTMLAALAATPVAARAAAGKRLFGDDFRHGLGQWRLEAASPRALVTARDGVLDIDTPAGLTLWFRQPLTSPVAIDYDVRAVQAGGPQDAVSDVNAFWMAQDPAMPGESALAAKRSGVFEDYDSLRTYYVGIGGNRNSTTRMRRYVGRAGDRPLLPDHDRLDPAAMLTPNRWFHLRLIADGGHIAVERDGETLFAMTDRHPYRHGHFGVRTTQSHIQLRNFAIIRL